MKNIIAFFLTIFLIGQSFSQSIPLSQQVQKRFNEIILAADTSVFTGFRSADWLEYKSFFNKYKSQVTDSAFGLSAGDPKGYFLKNISANNNWVQSNSNNSIFALDPYIDAGLGKANNQNAALYNIAAGLRLQGTINDKFSYSLGYTYAVQRFPSYLNNYIQASQNYVFGMGKGVPTGNNAFSFSSFTGHFTYIPNRHFLVSLGNGKNFVGDGYRSLVLSDNTSNYPYLRVQARYWAFTYNVIYAQLNNPKYQVDGSSQRKYSVTHYLGINFSRKFQMGVFDNVVWYVKDSNINRGFDVQYLNPIIFMRPIEFAVGSPDNAFLGLTAKYKLYDKGFLYGQLAIDDLHITESVKRKKQHFGNKYALQIGIWNHDLFNIKGLAWRLEWNNVRPYTYTHGFDKIGLNYTHDNQPLADPFGANFREYISMIQYNNGRWYGSLENLYAIRGEQPAGLNYPIGDDLWAGDLSGFILPPVSAPIFGSKIGQGDKNKYLYNQLSIGYLLNTRNRLALQADGVYRKHTSPTISESDFYFSIGIKTGLYNFYKDF